jgi:type II secretory pathway predicted ATPase ExeA
VRRPFLVVTGAPGTGKSTLVAEALKRWTERVTPAHLQPTDTDSIFLAGALLKAFGGTLKPGTPAFSVPERMLEVLANATSGGRIAVLLVDDADALPDDALLELQRLAGRAEQRQCPLEVILVGSHALAQRLDSPPFAGLRTDISVRVSLEPLSPHDTRHYLLQRPAANKSSSMFSRKACLDIHAAARGRIRDIEAIASEAARRAMRANASTVSPEHVRAAAQVVRSRRPADPVNAHPGEAPKRTPLVATPVEPEAPIEIEATVEPLLRTMPTRPSSRARPRQSRRLARTRRPRRRW